MAIVPSSENLDLASIQSVSVPMQTLPSNVSAELAENHHVCRICQCETNFLQEHLISPCQCKGSLGLFHRKCVEKWLGASNRTQCEICNTPYDIVRTQRPFREWLRTPERACDRRYLINDFVCFLVLFPVSLLTVCLCLAGSIHNLLSGFAWKYEMMGIIIVTGILEGIFVAWTVSKIRYHLTVWRSWRATHYQVQLRGNYPICYRSNSGLVTLRSESEVGTVIGNPHLNDTTPRTI